jgi:hypothetical protein
VRACVARCSATPLPRRSVAPHNCSTAVISPLTDRASRTCASSAQPRRSWPAPCRGRSPGSRTARSVLWTASATRPGRGNWLPGVLTLPERRVRREDQQCRQPRPDPVQHGDPSSSNPTRRGCGSRRSTVPRHQPVLIAHALIPVRWGDRRVRRERGGTQCGDLDAGRAPRIRRLPARRAQLLPQLDQGRTRLGVRRECVAPGRPPKGVEARRSLVELRRHGQGRAVPAGQEDRHRGPPWASKTASNVAVYLESIPDEEPQQHVQRRTPRHPCRP